MCKRLVCVCVCVICSGLATCPGCSQMLSARAGGNSAVLMVSSCDRVIRTFSVTLQTSAAIVFKASPAVGSCCSQEQVQTGTWVSASPGCQRWSWAEALCLVACAARTGTRSIPAQRKKTGQSASTASSGTTPVRLTAASSSLTLLECWEEDKKYPGQTRLLWWRVVLMPYDAGRGWAGGIA